MLFLAKVELIEPSLAGIQGLLLEPRSFLALVKDAVSNVMTKPNLAIGPSSLVKTNFDPMEDCNGVSFSDCTLSGVGIFISYYQSHLALDGFRHGRHDICPLHGV